MVTQDQSATLAQTNQHDSPFSDWTYEKMLHYTHSCVPPDASQAKFYIHVRLGKIHTEDFNHLKFNISDTKLLLYVQNVHSYSLTHFLCGLVRTSSTFQHR